LLRDYLRVLPPRIRVKVAAARDLEEGLELDTLLASELGLAEALARADESWDRLEGALERFGRDYPSAVPEPAILELPKESVMRLAEELSIRGADLFSGRLVLRIGGRNYALSVEPQCG
jgi:hypothetical protein